jgi:hypothetical protein
MCRKAALRRPARDTADRWLDRPLVKLGLLDDAVPLFRGGEHVRAPRCPRLRGWHAVPAAWHHRVHRRRDPWLSGCFVHELVGFDRQVRRLREQLIAGEPGVDVMDVEVDDRLVGAARKDQGVELAGAGARGPDERG